MFRFDEFVEDWASIYKPMLHEKGEYSRNRRFFLTDTEAGLIDFMTSIQPDQSPCVVMESSQEGTIGRGLDRPQYTLYFMVRAEIMGDGKSAYEAKLEAKQHMKKFITYIRNCQEVEEREQRTVGVRNIEVEDGLPYYSVGPFYNGWYGVYITLEDVQRFSKCVNEDDYIR